jgi:hypothetical protein
MLFRDVNVENHPGARELGKLLLLRSLLGERKKINNRKRIINLNVDIFFLHII